MISITAGWNFSAEAIQPVSSRPRSPYEIATQAGCGWTRETNDERAPRSGTRSSQAAHTHFAIRQAFCTDFCLCTDVFCAGPGLLAPPQVPPWSSAQPASPWLPQAPPFAPFVGLMLPLR